MFVSCSLLGEVPDDFFCSPLVVSYKKSCLLKIRDEATVKTAHVFFLTEGCFGRANKLGMMRHLQLRATCCPFIL